jgi:hypothetical protein
MNPIKTLASNIKIHGTRSLIEAADALTKIKFADWCVCVAKDDVDLHQVYKQAEHAYVWWHDLR